MTAAELTQSVELVAAQRVAAEAVAHWGAATQLRQVQEECAELIAAINRDARGRPDGRYNLIEEAGQVFLMLVLPDGRVQWTAEVDA